MKYRFTFLIATFLLLAGLTAKSQSPVITSAASPAKLQAAQELMDASGLATQLPSIYANMADVFMGQVPDDKKVKFKEIMLKFLNKYMSYAALKQDMSQLYAEQFTEAELKDITKFYLTPAGKKLNEKLSVLQQKGMALGQQKVQAHLPELQAEIKAAFPGQ